MDAIAWNFGKFTLLTDRRLLMAEGLPVRIGGRALDVLIALVELAGQFVSRDELIQKIWGTRVVEEINLRVQVATLRRMLGDDGRGVPRFILNVPTRGYCFVAPVTRIGTSRVAPSEHTMVAGSPIGLATLVGRDATVWKLVDELRTCRLVTIVGPGGVGKSAVAIKVAGAVAHRHPDGVIHVDLGGLRDAHVARDRIEMALGGSADVAHVTESIASALRGRKALLLLDGCEGVVDLAALVAERIQSNAPEVQVLATSCEPLRIPGEQAHRLGPLDVPPLDAASPDQALSFPSVRLFLDRMCTGNGDFDPSADDILRMATLCRRLDGMPLAIELAAHRAAHLGLADIQQQLADGFDVLVDERRMEAPHQESLRASFDWSFANLRQQERAVLCRLSVFAGGFSLASGALVASGPEAEGDDTVRELVGQLATKSLLSVGSGQGGVRYRLLDATRAYARERLQGLADASSTRLRHARWVIDLLGDDDAEPETPRSSFKPARSAWVLEEVRTAYDWLTQHLDGSALRMKLLAASVPHWFGLSAVAEYGERAAQALLGHPISAIDGDRIRVMIALGQARLHSTSPDAETLAASREAVSMAESQGLQDDSLAALWGAWLACSLSGCHSEALDIALKYEAIVASMPTVHVIGVVTEKHETLVVSAEAVAAIASDVMLLVGLMNQGRHAEARAHGERVAASSLLMPTNGARNGSLMDNEAVGRSSFARLLWIQGLPEKALAMAREAVEVARRAIDDLATCFCLHGLCVIALWCGDLEVADQAARALGDLARLHRLGYWNSWARFDDAAVAFVGGDPLRVDWREPNCGAPQLELMATLGIEHPDDETLVRADEGHAPWCEPEVLRVRGIQAALLETEQGRQKALALFERALQLARFQGALAWELRTVTSIASVSIQPGELTMAIDLLTRTLDRFTEGFSTRDVRQAASLLEELHSK